ncbi:MAG TPA: cell division protein ZipA C-terminal FtsZ-binding domain-containing protein [Telluria sp.]|nr:cell division protein ZipA C-terminal FtsZ-binding domain-containing protein [Telluria sp.]
MTELQMSLLAAGGVFIVGVFTYNKWQEYKAKKSVERAFSSDHDDVLMKAPGEGRHEPILDGAAAGERAEPVLDEPVVKGTDPEATPTELATSLVDPLIDVLVPLELEAAVRGDKVLPVLQKLRHVGNKPIHYIGLAVSGDWEPIQHGSVYTKLQAGVQMASRTTALNELEYSELVTRLRTVADEIGAEPEIPDMIEVMGEARNLHRFVANHDAQLGINLHTNGAPWAISTLIGALEKQGFDVRPDGRFVMPDGEGGSLFTLSTNVTLAEETTPRLTLLMDVPCVAPVRDGFNAMVACAKALVARLDATIVDDGGQPLSDEALAGINGQVQDFYDEMAQADIPAGSTRALRLFS